MNTAVWAHKGADWEAPENTLPSFERAVSYGADGIELDLQRTADGHLVVCHDETVDRTSDGTGEIARQELAALRTLDFSGGREGFEGTRIPLLEEVFELIRPTSMVVNVELKDGVVLYPGMDEQAFQLASAMGLSDRVIFSSFNHDTVRHLHRVVPDVPTAILYGEPLADPWDYAARLGATAIHPFFATLTLRGDAARTEIVDPAHAAGIAVNVWTVDEPDDIRTMIDLGVDAVITNRPDLALTIRAER